LEENGLEISDVSIGGLDTSWIASWKSGGTVRIAALALAIVVGWAGPSLADDLGPASDVAVPEKAPPDEAHGSHVHDVQPAPDRSAREVLKDIWTRDKLSGDWGGLRTDLADHGVYPEITFSQFGQGVASGGKNRNGEYLGKVDYRLNLDVAKLAGLWQGVGISLHAETRFGNGIEADAGAFALPNTASLYPLPDDYHDTDITGLLLTQMLFDERVTLFFGKIHTVDLVTLIFPEAANGLEGFWNINGLVPALPWFRFWNLSIWGGGGWTNQEEGIQSGLFFFGQENVSTTWEFAESFEDGVGLFGFYRFFYEIAGKPGFVMVGAGGATKKYPSLDSSDFINIPGAGPVSTTGKRPWDLAAYVQQVFWQAEDDPKRRAQFFMGGTGGNDNPNFSNWTVFASIEAFGPMVSRAQDRIGISFWYSGLSNDFVDLLDDLGFRARDTWGFELYYNFEINPWLHLTPDLQLIQNDDKDDDFAVIPGIRLVLDF
jgi:porin